jgi:hypothetical protein
MNIFTLQGEPLDVFREDYPDHALPETVWGVVVAGTARSDGVTVHDIEAFQEDGAVVQHTVDPLVAELLFGYARDYGFGA